MSLLDKPIEGHVTDARPHPAGRKGALISLNEVAERAWKARMSPRLKAWVQQQLVKGGVAEASRRDKAQCILAAWRKKVPYFNDPVMGEFMVTPDQALCLDDGGLCFMGGDCFPEGTLLLRDDFEFVPIEQIEAGEKIWGRDHWSTVTNKWSKGELSVDAVRLLSTTVCLTADHKVYVRRVGSVERIRVSELTPGEVLLQPRLVVCSRDKDEDGYPFWQVRQRSRNGAPLALVHSIERAVRKVPCWDISTDDHYVYLPEHDVTVSNCDDHSIGLIACMLCIGIPAMVVGSSHKEPHDTPTHVFMAFEDDFKNWVRMDGTTKHDVGKTPHHVKEWWVEPGKQAKDRGEGDFVGMHETGLSGPGDFDFRYPYLR